MSSTLELQAVIGFDGMPTTRIISTLARLLQQHTHTHAPGSVRNGLIYHPNGRFLIYPLGTTVVVKDVTTNKLSFLRGHSNDISALSLSSNGKFVCSGQRTHHGFLADVILWDLTTLSLKYRLQLHKVCIEDIAFNNDDTMVATLGGRDDGTHSFFSYLLDFVSNVDIQTYLLSIKFRTYHRVECRDWKTNP